MTSVERVPPFDAQHLQSIAKILADTDSGLTGSEIGYLLTDCRIPDPNPEMTKWKRLFNAFVGFQNQRQFGNHVTGHVTAFSAANRAEASAFPTESFRWTLSFRLNRIPMQCPRPNHARPQLSGHPLDGAKRVPRSPLPADSPQRSLPRPSSRVLLTEV
jgi:hypothetical protein